jgi:uncharacterized protein with FMN-binding domain
MIATYLPRVPAEDPRLSALSGFRCHDEHMKTSRSIGLVGASASLLATGWAVGTGFLNPTGATTSAAAVNVSGGTQVTSSSPPAAKSSSGSGSSASGSSSASGGSSSSSGGGTSGAGATGKFDGAVVPTRYGAFQVEAVIKAGKITNITMLQSGATDPTSQQITDYALPLLINEVLQQQTWNVGYVSGASYSTQGFETSLKDALAKAGLS